ncbi:ATP-binding protein [Streptomyces sp. Da 82-17]|uniref:ATP-binding protein n=1 Tax=Streptomyces sp. Da 82-17 TaxID=3377116 RepID=UPI0038D4E8BC
MIRTKAVAPDAAGAGNAAVLGFETHFPSAASQVRKMRRKTSECVRSWGLGSLEDSVTLAVSELVTNAVLHGGGGTVGLRVTCSGGELRIEVTDGNPVPARVRSASPSEESGRGLFLVAAVADKCGVSPDGLRTWCAFRISGGGA